MKKLIIIREKVYNSSKANVATLPSKLFNFQILQMAFESSISPNDDKHLQRCIALY